ncbi:MAG TPA: hypothetical protein VGD88_06250 [Opitutaceae bacterium]
MKVWETHLDARADSVSDQAEADTRWLSQHTGIDPAERLMKFDRWLRRQLLNRFIWPQDGAKREKLLRQCAAEMRTMFRDLHGRGWLLDGTALALEVSKLFDPIAKAQRAGKVGEFYPYFRAAVARYVGLNAEEIAAHARRTGSHHGTQSVGAILGALKVGGASLTELLATRAEEVAVAKQETLRVRQARLRRQETARKADTEARLPGL